jgi:hypothetical protein
VGGSAVAINTTVLRWANGVTGEIQGNTAGGGGSVLITDGSSSYSLDLTNAQASLTGVGGSVVINSAQVSMTDATNAFRVTVGPSAAAVGTVSGQYAVGVTASQAEMLGVGGSVTIDSTQVIAQNIANFSLILNAISAQLNDPSGANQVAVSSTGVLLKSGVNDLVIARSAPSGGGIVDNELAFQANGAQNTQLGIRRIFSQYGRVIAAGGGVTLDVPLPTNPSHVFLTITTMMKIVVAGTNTTVGDTWTEQGVIVVENHGTLLQVINYTPKTTAVSNVFLSPSAVAVINSGTDILIGFISAISAGTLGTADITIFAEGFFN